MYTRLYDTLQTNTRVLEVLYVISDLKPSARIALKRALIAPALKALESIRLKGCISDFSLSLDFSGSYSTKGRLTKRASENDYALLYIAKNISLAREIKDLEKSGHVSRLGVRLGYPKCCIKFFERFMHAQQRSCNDYIIPMLENSNPIVHDPCMNVFTRYFDFHLLSHSPCSLDCSESMDMAKKRLRFLKRTHKSAYDKLMGMAQSCAIYSKGDVLLLLHPKITKTENYLVRYSGICSHDTHSFLETFKSAECAELNSNLSKAKVNGTSVPCSACLFNSNYMRECENQNL